MALAATHFVCDTEFSADSVEFCPLPLHARFMAVGTYQLLPPAEPASADTKLSKGDDDDDDDDDDGQQDAAPVKTNRTGRLYLFEVAQEGDGSDTSVTVNQVFRQETSAILDIKWSHQALNGDAVAAIVTSTGETEVWALEPETRSMKQMASLSNGKDGVLNLSVDWPNRLDAGAGHGLVVSQSDGCLVQYDCRPDAGLTAAREWSAHGFEAWIASFNYHQTHTVYSGGDDSLFKGWDLRTDCDSPIFTNKSHQAGVCSISSHPAWDHVLATGSYDENIRIWDTRAMRRPVSETSTGGGVWRLRWHPKDPTALLAACMYNGFHVYTAGGQDQLDLEHTVEYMHHKSIAYGADWSFAERSAPSPSVVGTCSFYDHLLHVWTVDALNRK